MKLIVVALQSEAEPIIAHFGLNAEMRSPFKLWRNEDVILVVSGVGSIASVIATTSALSSYREISEAINIGICASSDPTRPVGKLFAVHKIVDDTTNRVYHLQRDPELPTAPLHTFAQPQKRKKPKVVLADMEASGFYEAARKFLPKEQIVVLKVVSDHMEDRIPSREEVWRLMDGAIPALERIVSDH